MREMRRRKSLTPLEKRRRIQRSRVVMGKRMQELYRSPRAPQSPGIATAGCRFV